MSHLLDKIIVPYSFYDKVYLEETDTAIYTLKINNNFFNVWIKITIVNYCSLNNNFTSIEILTDTASQYYNNIGIDSYNEALYIAQDFLIMNNLLMYVKGFAIPAFSEKAYQYQTIPKSTNYEPTNNNTKDR